MVGAHVPKQAAETVRDAILAIKDAIIAGSTAHEENDKYIGVGLVAIDDNACDYAPAMYSNAGYPQFDNFIGDRSFAEWPGCCGYAARTGRGDICPGLTC